MSIDPTTMARFLVLPGATELLEAFATIPPGALRESVIQHARVIAQTYAGAPAAMQMPDPLLTAARAVAPPPALEPPARKPVKTEDPATRAVELRLQGQHPQAIAKKTGLFRAQVETAIRDARKAGVRFPNLRLATGRPLEEKTWVTDVSQLSGQGINAVKVAAAARGISMEEYLSRKGVMVEMAQRGETYDAIMKATHSDRKTVSLTLSNARAAGLNVPYAPNAKGHGQIPDDTNVIRPTRFFGPWEAIKTKAKYTIGAAATRRGMTPEAFLELQNSIVGHRMAGVGGTEIATLTGETETFVKDTLSAARARGAAYPPLQRRGHA